MSYRWTELRERIRCKECHAPLKVAYWPVRMEDGRMGLFKRFTCPQCDEKRRAEVFGNEVATHE